jgi:phage shock protein E
MRNRFYFPFLLGLVLGTLGLQSVDSRQGQDKESAKAKVHHVDAKEAAKLVATNGVVVLDVRTPEEYADGHIAGATNISFLSKDFAEQVGKLDRSKTYLVHCASGRRSTSALPVLSKLNFTNLIHLDNGFNAWEEANNPVTKK